MNNRKKIVNCVISFLLSAVLVFSGILGYVVPAQAVSACAGTITVAVERFAIGQGYLIEPYTTTFNKGDTYETVCRRVLEENGYSYDVKGTGFYLSGIYGADAGKISIPDCIGKIGSKKLGTKYVDPPDNSAVNEYAGKKAWLGEFSYSRMSGWMYSVGNSEGCEFPGVGMDGKSPQDGDVFRLQFTVWGYGEDLTGYSYPDGAKVYYPVGDKTSLTKKIAQINQNRENWFAADGCKEAYDDAIAVLQKLDATQKELDDALAQLPAEEPVFPDKVTLQKSKVTLYPGDTFQLEASLTPDNVNQSALTWSTSDSKAAAVDQNGLVTAREVGTADITVATQNKKTAVCRITVEDRAITKITLNMTGVSLEIGESAQLKVVSYEPENATEKLELTWSSGNQESVSVDAQGTITCLKFGETDITAVTKGGVSAVCRVTVGTPKELAQAMEVQIHKLPEAGQVTDDNAGQVMKVWQEYTALSDQAKAEMDAEAVAKLEAVRQEAETVIERQEQVEKVREMLKMLPSAENISLSDESSVQEARSAYNALDAEQQKKIDADLKTKLTDLEKRISELKAEADSVGKQIQAFPEAVTAENAADAVNLWKTYDALAEDQKTYLGKTCETRMDQIRNQTVSCITETVNAVDRSKTFDLNSADVQDFIMISNVCEAMDKTQTDRLPAKTQESIADIRQWIEEQIHTIAVTGISVPSTESVGIGNSISLDITFKPFNATTDKSVVLKSSDSSVVKVNSDGTLKGMKPGSVNVTVSLKSDPSIQAVCRVTVTDKANKLKKSVDQVMKETSAYMLSIDKNPTIGSEWFVLGLARSGKSLNLDYFKTYYNHVANYLEENDGKLTNTVKYTEYSKMILVMTAMGKDARNIAGYNLLENLADFNMITRQGFNGPIWALIALKSNPEYEIPKVSGVSEQTTEAKLISYLLDGEISGGGWALEGEEADTDITAMTLQALAPYYNRKGYEKVTAAIDRAVNKLSKMQLNTGGFGTMGAETLESNAQVITALCALGIDPQTDARFIKNGKWTVENLISYHIDNSGFMHVKAGAANNGGAQGGIVNGMATEQGFYALTAYQRFCDGKTSLYDMSDMNTSAGGKGDGKGTGVTDPKEDGSGTSTGSLSGSNKGKYYSGIISSDSKNTGSSTSGSQVSTGSKTAGKTVGSTVGKAIGKTAGKTADQKAEKEEEPEPWSFDGKTYVPDTISNTGSAAASDTGTEQETADEETGSMGSGGIFTGENAPYILIFVLGAVLGATAGVLISGRKKRAGFSSLSQSGGEG